MTTRSRSTVVAGVGLLPILVFAALSLFRPAALNPIELAVYDRLVRAADRRLPGGQVVIVNVDERSLDTFGQWPWRRDLVGRLISNLRALDAKVIALDIIFAEPDRFGAAGLDPDSALADYALGGVSDEGWSTRGAGLIGLVVTAGVGVVVFSAVRRRSAGHDRAR